MTYFNTSFPSWYVFHKSLPMFSVVFCNICSLLSIPGTWQHTWSFKEIDANGIDVLHPNGYQAGSSLSCMIYCHKTPSCLLFSFDGEEVGVCQLSSSALLSNTSTSAGTKIYKNRHADWLLTATFSTLLARGQWINRSFLIHTPMILRVYVMGIHYCATVNLLRRRKWFYNYYTVM